MLLMVEWSESEPASADHVPQPPDELVYTASFSTSGQNKWGPGEAVNLTSQTFPLVGTSWNESGSAGDTASFGGNTSFAGIDIPIPTVTFGGSISAGTTGEIGLDAVYRDFDTGEISVDYPIEATFTVPKRDTYRETETITIGSSFRLQPGWSLGTVPPNLGALDIVGTFGFTSFANVEICIFVCSGQFPIAPPINIPTNSVTLFTLDSNERIVLDPLLLAQTIVDAPPTDPLRAALASVIGTPTTDFLWTTGKGLGVSLLATYISNFTMLGNFGGHMGLPSVQTTDALAADGRGLVANGTDNYIDLTIDLDGILTTVIGVPSLEFSLYPLCVGSVCTSFGFNILDVETVIKMFQTEQYQLNPFPRVRFDLPAEVEFTISGCSETDPLNFIDPSNPIFPWTPQQDRDSRRSTHPLS